MLINGNSLAVQWLGLGAFTALAQVQSLVRELRSRTQAAWCGQTKQNKTRVLIKFANLHIADFNIHLLLILLEPSAVFCIIDVFSFGFKKQHAWFFSTSCDISFQSRCWYFLTSLDFSMLECLRAQCSNLFFFLPMFTS